MKKNYRSPQNRVFALDMKSACMLSMSESQVDTSSGHFEQRTNESSIWDSEDVWE